MLFHNHHIVPRHMGGTNDARNITRVNVALHAFLHKCLYEEHGLIEDKIAWLALSGQIGHDEISQLTSVLGGRNAAKSWTEERKNEQSLRLTSYHRNGKIPSLKGKKYNVTDNRWRWNGPIGNKWMYHQDFGSKQIESSKIPEYQSQGWKLGRLAGPKFGRPANGMSKTALWRHAKKLKQQQGEVSF